MGKPAFYIATLLLIGGMLFMGSKPESGPHLLIGMAIAGVGILWQIFLATAYAWPLPEAMAAEGPAVGPMAEVAKEEPLDEAVVG